MNLKELKKLDKRRTDLLKFSVSKDETRPHLMHVWHDPDIKALVSTNGHTATILKSRYNSRLDNILIDSKTFEVSMREPVKIVNILPSKFRLEVTYTIEKHHYVRQIGAKVTKAHFFEDGSISMGGNSSEWGFGRKRLFTVNASFLKHLATGHSYTFGYNAELTPVVVALNEGNLKGDIFVIMPLNEGS